jgi:imidazole glycerol-phosphate synthase subunit HisH
VKVVIIDYGAGNTQSVKFALQRLGTEPVLSNAKDEILGADKVIFSGVGHAKAAMISLREKELQFLIPQLKQPVLGICLGMQLLCSFSEEGNTECLGILKEHVRLFPSAMKVPHMGWNTVSGNWQLSKTDADWFYFVHSYYVPQNHNTTLNCSYMVDFSAAIQKDNFYGVQFHPEKSGPLGEKLLHQFFNL